MNYPFRTPAYQSINYIFPTLLWCSLLLEELSSPTWIDSPFLGTRCPRIIFTIGRFLLSKLRQWNSSQGKKLINYFMQFLVAISWSLCGSCVPLTGGAICNLSGSACTAILSWVLKSKTEPAFIFAQHIYKGTGLREKAFRMITE